MSAKKILALLSVLILSIFAIKVQAKAEAKTNNEVKIISNSQEIIAAKIDAIRAKKLLAQSNDDDSYGDDDNYDDDSQDDNDDSRDSDRSSRGKKDLDNDDQGDDEGRNRVRSNRGRNDRYNDDSDDRGGDRYNDDQGRRGRRNKGRNRVRRNNRRGGRGNLNRIISNAKRNKLRSGKYQIQIRGTRKCLDVARKSIMNGARLHSWDCVGVKNQVFEYETRSKRFRTHARGKCLDMSGNRRRGVNTVSQRNCHNGRNQKWLYDRNSGLIMTSGRNRNSMKCLTVKDRLGRNGSMISAENCRPNALNQKWDLRLKGRSMFNGRSDRKHNNNRGRGRGRDDRGRGRDDRGRGRDDRGRGGKGGYWGKCGACPASLYWKKTCDRGGRIATGPNGKNEKGCGFLGCQPWCAK